MKECSATEVILSLDALVYSCISKYCNYDHVAALEDQLLHVTERTFTMDINRALLDAFSTTLASDEKCLCSSEGLVLTYK